MVVVYFGNPKRKRGLLTLSLGDASDLQNEPVPSRRILPLISTFPNSP